MSHLQTEHQPSQYWECFACDEFGRFFDVETFSVHIRLNHREAISEHKIPTLIDICSQTALPNITSCPLCDFAVKEGGNVDENALLDHVAEHVHSFSLRSLPWATDINEGHKANFDSSIEKVRDWFNGWPTQEKGEEYYPVSDTGHSVPDSDNYFRQNNYFADDSEHSSHAQMGFHTSSDDSEGRLDLSSLSEEDYESIAAANESIAENILDPEIDPTMDQVIATNYGASDTFDHGGPIQDVYNRG